MYANDCRFIGQIINPVKEKKTKAGSTYIYLAVEIVARANANSTENNARQIIHIMCFRRQTVAYLRKVGAKKGNFVVVFGFISVFREEVRGKDRFINAVNANEVYVIKTRKAGADEVIQSEMETIDINENDYGELQE